MSVHIHKFRVSMLYRDDEGGLARLVFDWRGVASDPWEAMKQAVDSGLVDNKIAPCQVDTVLIIPND